MRKLGALIGGWNGHVRRGWLAQPRRLTLLQCSVLLLREGGLIASSGITPPASFVKAHRTAASLLKQPRSSQPSLR